MVWREAVNVCIIKRVVNALHLFYCYTSIRRNICFKLKETQVYFNVDDKLGSAYKPMKINIFPLHIDIYRALQNTNLNDFIQDK